MATEAQRARRRRNRQRRASGNARGTSGPRRSTGKGIQPITSRASAMNPGVWLTEIHSLAITALTGAPTEKIWCFKLEDSAPLKAKLNSSGEYRLLSIRCTYNPITAQTNDRVGIAPYFDPINKLGKVANFLANGRPLRKGDARFTETWNVPSEITSVVDLANPIEILGGVCVFFHKDPFTAAVAQVDAFIITVDITYQVRGKKADLNTVSAT